MRLLLIALIAFMTLSSVFAWDPGPMTGVKIKNAILYLLVLGLLIRIALEGRFKLELPKIQAAFVILILYAILSYGAVIFIVEYPRYDWVENGLDLKGFVDQLLFFLVFFYGLRSTKDGIFILKCLLLAWTLSHVMALLDAQGIVHIGDIEQRSDGRVQGLVGESNQYGAFVALSVPATIAIAMATRGAERILWTAAALISGVTLVMTVSRGAFVAIAIASIWGLIVFRRHASLGKLVMWAGSGLLVAIVLLSVAAALGFGDLLYQRLISDSVTADMGYNSSGRTEIWSTAIATMFQEPLTLITGYGWRAYWTFPFRYSPHNYYVNQWFNLGLVGLACSILLFVWTIRFAKQAADVAEPVVRTLLIGFAVATMTFAVATFFVDLYIPWLYFWGYAGIAMRLGILATEAVPAAVRTVTAQPVPRLSPRPQYGWTTARRP